MIVFIWIASTDCLSKEIDLTSYVEKKQFVLAGTLNPPSISLNGQQLETPDGQFKNLFVNDELVPIKTTEGLRTFFHSVHSDSISLDWQKMDGEKQNFLNLQLPSLTQLKTNGHELNWVFSKSVAKAKLDADEIPIETPVTPIQNLKKWMKQPHVLELISPNNASQIYQLDFSSYQREIFRRRSVSYILGEPSLNFLWDSASSGFGFAVHFEDDRYLDINYLYSEKDRVFEFGTESRPINQKLYELKSRYGRQFFNSNWNDFDLLRLTAGVQGEIARYLRTSTTVDSFDGFNSQTVDSTFGVVGVFSRWEPIQFNDFGFSLTIDFPVMATNRVSNIFTVAYFSLNYYFK